MLCDLSGSPIMDLAGARMLAELCEDLHARGITLTVVSAHGTVRDLLRAEGLDGRIHGVARGTTLDDALARLASA
ncbi:MAG TPA: sodium-independent anion transporter [Acetobacteraceae bacterium]|nr:sodium-independent anion transporter [Acetobacteraceae bacterium]